MLGNSKMQPEAACIAHARMGVRGARHMLM